MHKPDFLTVEVAYALPEQQFSLPLKVPPGTTAREAIDRSGLLQTHPEIDLTRNKVGVFGKLTRLDQVLREGDRLEVYRPLKADPKEVRKLRAAQGKKMRRGGGMEAAGGAD